MGPERGGRERNEDNYLICRQDKARYRAGAEEVVEPLASRGLLMAVADGMGGHEDGELASSAAVRAMARLFKRGAPRHDPELHLHRFVLDAHRRLHAKVAELGPVRMGTTLTTAWALESRLYWCQVGDSRLYLYRDGDLRLVTRDHTRGEFATRDGRPLDADAPYLAQNFVYGSRGFGMDHDIRIDAGTDTGAVNLRVGDRLLLCSDGLHGAVPDYRIADLLREVPEPQAAAVQLMERAMASGSEDNITVVVARVDQVARELAEGEDPLDMESLDTFDNTLVPEGY